VKALRQKARDYQTGIGVSPTERRAEKEREELKAVFSQLFAEEIRTPAAYLVLKEIVERVLIEREAKPKRRKAKEK